MKINTDNFNAANNAVNKELRLVVKIAFDTNADIFFTSHSDITISGETVVSNVLRKTSSTTQRIDPNNARATIGAINFELIDVAEAVTTVFRDQLDDDNGLRGKTVELYLGYIDLGWNDFRLEQTQIIDKSMSYKDGVYRVQCRDIQREARKQIFEIPKTRLAADVSIGDSTIDVFDASGFEPVTHGTSYTQDPSTSIFYFKIKKGDGFEICSATGATATSFTGVSRGLFGTDETTHTIKNSENSSPEITEYIYLEMPAVKLIYALLTGVLVNESASLPDHYHLGIQEDWVDLSAFTGIGTDLYDHEDDQNGLVTRFQGLTKTDGKRFIEQQLLLLSGCVTPILPNGKLSLKKVGSVLTGASYVDELDESNIVNYSPVNYDLSNIKNNLDIYWSYLELQNGEKDFYRINRIIDSDSITRYGETAAKPMKFYGLHGSRHTIAIISHIFDVFRDRVAGAAARLTLNVLPSMNNIEVGDIVNVNLQALRDHTGLNTFNRSMEVQAITIDQLTQSVKLTLYGSTQGAGIIEYGEETTLPDEWYCDESATEMTDLSTVLTITGGVVTTSGTITGHSNHEDAIYYYTGDLTINAGVNVAFTGNVQLRIRGHLTVNGTIDGQGNGLAATTDSYHGMPGAFGRTRQTGGVINYTNSNYPSILAASTPNQVTSGTYQDLSSFSIVNNAGVLSGWPTDLRGTSGAEGSGTSFGDGAPAAMQDGGAGGDGGAGIVIVCRGMSFGAAGTLNASGNDGGAGVVHPNGYTYSGGGAGGASGAVYLLLDGTDSVMPIKTGNIITNQGSSTDYGNRFGVTILSDPDPDTILVNEPGHSYFEAYSGGHTDVVKVEYVPSTTSTYPVFSCGSGGGSTNPDWEWRLDETTGSVCADSLGSDDLTYWNNYSPATVESFTNPSFPFDIESSSPNWTGRAKNFAINGANIRDSAPLGSRTIGNFSGSDFTIEFPFATKFAYSSGEQTFLTKRIEADGGWRFGTNSAEAVFLYLHQSDLTFRNITLTAGLQTEGITDASGWHWMSLRMDYSGTGILDCRVDDVELGDEDVSSWSGTWYTSLNSILQIARYGTGNNWQGRLDNIRFYQSALSSDDRTANYEEWLNGAPTPTVPTVAIDPAGITENAANGSHTTASVTATPTDITPVNWSWTRVSGSLGIMATTPSAATTTFNSNSSDTTLSTTFRVTATDVNSYTASNDITITITHGHEVIITPSAFGQSLANGTQTTNSVTASHFNMIETVSYSWSRVSGMTSITIDSPSAATTTFTSTGTNMEAFATFKVTATDANNDVGEKAITVYLEHGTPP